MGVENSKSDLSVMDKTFHLEGRPLQINNKQYLMLSAVSNDFPHQKLQLR